MTNMLRAFRPEVVTAIKLTVVVGLTCAYVVTFAWGYEGRQQARRWREVACVNRLSELTRVTPGRANVNAPCEALERVGIEVVAGAR